MISKHESSYRLLYFTPEPEDAEQLCVGVLVFSEGKWIVDFDDHLSKIRCAVSSNDIEYVRTMLDALRADLNGQDLQEILHGIQPQFKVSSPRKLLVPWSPRLQAKLRHKFLSPSRQETTRVEREHQKHVDLKIKNFLSEIMPSVGEHLIMKVQPVDLLGRELASQMKGAKPVARAIVGRTKAVLVDGVDVTLKPSSEVIRKANKIAFTFWQYERIARSIPVDDEQHPKKFFKVGIVFDGDPKALLLREYSLHQFHKDADLAIESEKRAHVSRVREEIEKTIADIRL